jgi:hypothetical protein
LQIIRGIAGHFPEEENMVLGQDKRAIGMFSNHLDAQQALNELIGAGFPVNQLYVVAQDTEHEEMLCIELKERMEEIESKDQYGKATGGTLTGTLLGAIAGSLVGIGVLSVPGVALVAVGSSLTALATTLTGAGLGAVICGLIETIAGSGICQDTTTDEQEDFWRGKYLVMVEGTEEEVRRASWLLSHSLSGTV